MRRLFVLAGLFLLLAGCGGGDDRAPFTESRIPPSLGPRFWAPEGWAWGLIGVGDAPVQRYGVSSTAGTPRGNILILTDDRELAEAWFETARDLNTMGYSVWVLERAGQGGSARYGGGPRDLIHVPTFDDDIAATKALARSIVAADSETPLTVVGQGVGALIALRAVQTGAPAAALVLSSPKLKPDSALPGWPHWLMKLGAGRLPASVGQGWKREGPDDFKAGRTQDRQRGAVQLAWQTANPDLRMGGHSLGWTTAFGASSKEAFAALPTTRTKTHALLVPYRDSPDDAGFAACAGMPACTVTGITPPPGTSPSSLGRSAFLQGDGMRSWWIKEVVCETPDHPDLPALPRDGRCAPDQVLARSAGHQL